ncbi:MAG: YraN family protein [Candidatus Yanofskybacteria bacterium CG10_big_fil_rev_8_21_14_0_10_46_23]|uniref:UPF0102 protein COV31_02690 n=1 Tax=Candidatus Yanofskybacteria bacterium CG10_big_fil_rev_8_21_14_0_10_46_23 TaxID=1975098 RepID=A0A2H0R4A6_9BACT|nr:MAG: YraN family protein [Candidatus Yanofskybacteria bacterium CG10_big_fil_rev_8_21_14_0_10_46_23]
MSFERKNFGNWAETLATDFLKKKGYKILARNYRRPWGEIDIIAQKAGIIVFVEVKASRQKQAGTGFSPELRVNPQKGQKILRVAQSYLGQGERPWQVDIVAVTQFFNQPEPQIEHLENVLDNAF